MRVLWSLFLVLGLMACGDDDGVGADGSVDATLDALVGDATPGDATLDAPSADAVAPPADAARPDGTMGPVGDAAPEDPAARALCQRVVDYYVGMCWSVLQPRLTMPDRMTRTTLVSRCARAAVRCTDAELEQINMCLMGPCEGWVRCIDGVDCLGPAPSD